MISWHGYVLLSIERIFKNIRTFSNNNSSFVEVFFTVVYGLEQLYLIRYTFSSKNIEQMNLIISQFVLMVLMTFALQKLVLESKMKRLEKEVIEIRQEKVTLGSYVKDLHKGYEELLNRFSSKSLNNPEKGKRFVKKR